MAAGAFLPPVVTRLTGDIGDLAAKIAEAKALIGSLEGKTVFINVIGNAGVNGINEAIARIAALRAAMGSLDSTTVRVSTDVARTGAVIGRWGGMFRLTAFAIRFLIMTAVEILATAIPALFALGAAVVGMMSTFIHIGDQMNFLRIATGDWRTALIDSVGPLHNIGTNLGILQAKMAPDAYIIFGSTINALSGHFGMFSKVAQQAGQVLSNFAVKLSTELSGGLGASIAKFFGDAVRLMTQWGQVIGNIGRIFLNVIGAMWGSAKVFLFILDAVTRGLALLTGNPVVAWAIGLIFAFESAARWAKFFGIALTWLGNTAFASAIKGVVTYMGALIALIGEEGVVVAATTVMGDLMEIALGPVGIAFALIGLAVGAYIMSTRKAGDATDQLIAKVQKMPNSLTSLDKGFGMLTHGLNLIEPAFNKAATAAKGYGRYAGLALMQAQATATSDTAKLTAAIEVQAQKIIALRTGMAEAGMRTGQVGAAMKALSIATALQDSKVTQLNQGIDTFLTLIAGGTGNLYSFANALSTFGKSMTQSTRAGAQAWNNFSGIVGQTAPKLMDWFRQAAVLGAITGKAVTKAALDMAAGMAHLAGSNKTAQAETLAFARANGISAGSFKQLLEDIKKNGAGQADLKKKVDATTTAMANLSQMAQNASNALKTQVSSAIAQTALQAVNFHQKLLKLQTDMANGASARKIQSDLRAVRGAMSQAQQMAIQTGNATQGAMGRAAGATANLRKQVEMLHHWIAMLHNKNITITATINQVGGIVLPGGGGIRITQSGASGIQSARKGWGRVGENGPELVHFNGGERVYPHHVSTGSSSPAASGGGMTEIHLYLDSKEIFPAIKQQTYDYNVKNNNRSSSGKVRGVMVPG